MRTGVDQCLCDAGDFHDDMLAIIDDQQELLGMERRGQGLGRGSRTAQADTQYGTDGESDQLRIGERSELCKPHAVRITVEDAPAHLDGEPRLADTSRSGQRHEAMAGESCLYLCNLGLASDQTGQRVWKIVAGRRTSRSCNRRCLARHGCRRSVGLVRAVAFHGCHEAIAPPRYRHQVAPGITRLGQNLPQGRDVHLNVIFFNNDTWPDRCHEFVLRYQLPVAAHQQQQYFEGTLADCNGHAVGHELAPTRRHS